MSGIYIPGMEKSKTCAFCRFCEGLADTQLGSCAFCAVDGKTRAADAPPKDCFLIPVPPHGRLIDASENITVQIYDDMTEDFHIVEMTIDDLLSQGWIEANAPTIVPADKEGEG